MIAGFRFVGRCDAIELDRGSLYLHSKTVDRAGVYRSARDWDVVSWRLDCEEIGMLRRVGIVVALMAFFAFPLVSWAQQSPAKKSAPAPADSKAESAAQQHEHGHHEGHGVDHVKGGEHAKGHGVDDGHHAMMAKCMEMNKENEKTVAQIKAMDDRLDEKLAVMKSAQGDQKLAAMEAVISELVSQRKEMRDKMGEMHHQKAMCGMCGMMGKMDHGKMGAGGMAGMSGKCPMMKKDPGSDAKPSREEAAKPEGKM
jgi:hypothetical protein